MQSRNVIKHCLVFILVLMLQSCVGMPDTVTPVNNFDVQKYLGTWHEIARLDHSFERGMSQVTATYSLRDDGGLKVVNRGYTASEEEWSEAIGKAYFVEQTDIGYLKVSFFGPFYGSYVVFELDSENYEYAFVSGPDLSYLWLLARTPIVDKDIINKFKQSASNRGFDISQLIMVEQ